jgi:hypothetical protein
MLYVLYKFVAGPGHQHVRKAKLNLVDLAGSERHGKVGKLYNERTTFELVFLYSNPISKQINPETFKSYQQNLRSL